MVSAGHHCIPLLILLILLLPTVIIIVPLSLFLPCLLLHVLLLLLDASQTPVLEVLSEETLLQILHCQPDLDQILQLLLGDASRGGRFERRPEEGDDVLQGPVLPLQTLAPVCAGQELSGQQLAQLVRVRPGVGCRGKVQNPDVGKGLEEPVDPEPRLRLNTHNQAVQGN